MRWLTRMLSAAILCAALVSTAQAQANFTLSGIDAMTSTVIQEGQSSFSGIGLRMRIQSPAFVAGVEFMPTIEYWRNTSSVTAPTFAIRTTRKDATLGVDTRYTFGTEGLRPYVGAGFGLHFLSNSVDAPALNINNQSYALVKGGLSVMGGASFALAGKLENFTVLKSHTGPAYRQLKINWGLAYKL